MIDIGVNLLHPQFDPDRPAVIARARRAGLTGMLVTATDLDTTAAAIQCTADHADLRCTAGVHPHDASRAPADLSDRLRDYARCEAVAAIGEIGLDFNRNFSPEPIQRQVFEAQLALAAELGSPVFVHDRDSDGAVAEALTGYADKLPHIVVHCFTGSKEDLDGYLKLGCFIGITGWVCDQRRGQPLRDIVGSIPLERLMIETDAPFLLPQNVPAGWHADHQPTHSRRRNEPALLRWVAEGIGQASGASVEEIVSASTANANRVFAFNQAR